MRVLKLAVGLACLAAASNAAETHESWLSGLFGSSFVAARNETVALPADKAAVDKAVDVKTKLAEENDEKARAKAKVDEKVKADEEAAANALADALKDKETEPQLHLPVDPARKGGAQGPVCAVEKTGLIEYANDPREVLVHSTHQISIKGLELKVTKPGKKKEKVKMSINAIQFPLETMDKTQRCFRMYYQKKPHVFCTLTTDERDEWMNTITEARFCLGSTEHLTEKPEKNTESAGLPQRSTKEQRWEAKKLADMSAKERRDAARSMIASMEGDVKQLDINIHGGKEAKAEVEINGQTITAKDLPAVKP